ncbi:GNAT family N-acetyltransferase [Celerinatantimonas sp. YJH-8]
MSWFLLHPKLRGLGVGHQLITLLMDFAREQRYIMQL